MGQLIVYCLLKAMMWNKMQVLASYVESVKYNMNVVMLCFILFMSNKKKDLILPIYSQTVSDALF